MSTSKNVDKICIVGTCITLVLTILFMFGGSLGLTIMASAMPYESKLFDTSYVHEIDIVMNDWDEFIENCESEEYSPCTVVVDGEKYSNVAIRAKGNTSLSTVSSLGSDRYSFKLEFDHYDENKSLDGLDKLCLNNLIQDNTMMKDYIVYQLMYDFGVDAPLCSFAYITVNGEDWGLYLAVEGIEDSFLERNYGSEVGDLYKPDSISNGGGRGNGKDFSMDDFDFESIAEAFEQGDQSEFEQDGQGSIVNPFEQGSQGSIVNPFEQSGDGDSSFPTDIKDISDIGDIADIGGGTSMGSDDVKLKYIDDDPDSYSNIFDNGKTDVTEQDKSRLISSLKNLSSYTDLENTVDIDEVIRYFVIHNFVCNGDSYTGSMIHNYYLYEEDGVMSMIPWDYNLAFGTFQGGSASSTVNTSIDSPVSGGTVDDRPMLGWIFSSDEYTETYHELFAEFIEKWFTNGELAEMISETGDMIRSYVEKDPSKFCTTEEFEAGIIALSEFVTLRAEAVTKQLNGDDSLVDTGDLNLSDMGTMNNNVGGDMGGGEVPSLPDGGGDTPSMPTGEFDPEDVPGTPSSDAPIVTPDASQVSATGMAFKTSLLSNEEPIAANGDQPSMPSGDMPAMPTGGEPMASGDQPAMPTGGEPMASGDQPAMPTGGEPMASGDQPAMPTGEQPVSSGDIPAESTGEQPSMPSGGDIPAMPTGGGDMGGGNVPDMPGGDTTPTNNTEMTQWLLVLVSVIVLAIGLVVVVKKKI